MILRGLYSVRRAVAVPERAAQEAGARAPATAITSPASARPIISGSENTEMTDAGRRLRGPVISNYARAFVRPGRWQAQRAESPGRCGLDRQRRAAIDPYTRAPITGPGAWTAGFSLPLY